MTYSEYLASTTIAVYSQLYFSNSVITSVVPPANPTVPPAGNRLGNVATKLITTTTLGQTLINNCVINLENTTFPLYIYIVNRKNTTLADRLKLLNLTWDLTFY